MGQSVEVDKVFEMQKRIFVSCLTLNEQILILVYYYFTENNIVTIASRFISKLTNPSLEYVNKKFWHVGYKMHYHSFIDSNSEQYGC